MLLTVTAKKLNKRKIPVSDLSDKTGIMQTVKKGFTFEGEAIIFGDVKWYRDKEGFYYWGGGITESVSTEIKIDMDKAHEQNNWGFEDFKIEELWKLSRGKEIKVALLD